MLWALHLVLVARAASANEFRIERKGQDTHVYRASDDRLVYTTSVADTSEGSDTDSDMKGDEEFFNGCMWTFRQQLGMCDGGNCGDAEILAHDIQRRFQDFYRERHGRAVPPLEEATWLTVGMRQEHRGELAETCPGLMVTALLFMAEALLFSGSPQGEAYAQEAEVYAATLQQRAPTDFETMLDMFPVREAWDGLEQARRQAVLLEGTRTIGGSSVDIVVARCKSSLQWLWELDFPADSRVFVYDKCQNSSTDFEEQTAGLSGVVRALEHRPLQECGVDGFMTGECTAYLAHLLASLPDGSLADFTVFVHDDAPRHIRLSLLSLVLRSIRSGTYDTPFLHLSHERYPAFRTRCLRDVYRRAFGKELPGTLSTYCCSHFVVRRDRIEARTPDFFAGLHRLVAEAPYARLHGGECNIGAKPCYVVEFLWHHVFGEDDNLPMRAEQGSLPLALRYEGGRSSRLPSPLQVAPYMAMFQPSRYSSLLERSR